MTGAEVLLICGVSAFAAAMGWFAARLTSDGSLNAETIGLADATGEARISARSKRSHGFSGSRAHDLERSSPGFVAVIGFDPTDSENVQGALDTPGSSDLESILEMGHKFPSLRVTRIAGATLECEFSAALDKDATTIIEHVCDEMGGAVGAGQMYAGLAAVDRFPAAQETYDAAHSAFAASLSSGKRVVIAGTSENDRGTKTGANTASRLINAVRNGDLSLAYQPKLDVRNQDFPAAEALLRWDTPEGRQHSVGDMIVSAERYGAIRDVTLWTLKRAISDQLVMLDQGIEITTFVNLSGTLVSDSEFTLQAIEIIKAAAGKIGLEITETSVIAHAGNALSNLELYSAAGAEIAIDDYGTGLSSLRYLKRIPAQELKIDREFIKDLTNSHRDPMIVRSTIDLAHALGLKVTAEGVDDATKMALLKVMGCDNLQGFHIAKPMTLTALIEFMTDREKHNSLMNSELYLLPGKSA